MSQEFFCEDDHVEMVVNWLAESVECEDCYGEGCKECDGHGRIARCELGKPA